MLIGQRRANVSMFKGKEMVSMSKDVHDRAEPDIDLGQVTFALNSEQSRSLAELLANPRPANKALRDLMPRPAPWSDAK